MKYCKNCKFSMFYSVWEFAYPTPECLHPKHSQKHENPLHGRFWTHDELKDARVALDKEGCGLEAKYYERKWWKLWAPK